MQSTTSLPCSLLPTHPSLLLISRPERHRNVHLRRDRVTAKGRRDPWDFGSGHRMVDESMIVLRKRIHEMKMVERNYEPPADWMEWEKQLYTSYDSNVCLAVGILQTQLMNMRPSLALGMASLVVLSVPTSAFFILFHLIAAANGILSG